MNASNHSQRQIPHNESMALFDDFLANMEKLAARRGWTMAELARRSGISKAGISLIVNRQRDVTTETIEKVARAFRLEGRQMVQPEVGSDAYLAAERLKELALHANQEDLAMLLRMAERCVQETPGDK